MGSTGLRWAALLLVLAVALAWSETGASSTKAKNKSKKTATGTASSARARHGRYAAKRKSAGPSYQARPTPERYKEIQQALSDKGYFKGQINGEWGDDSTEALKRFQADHKLTDDGKINSLSLIQLGLGPKHDGSTAPAPSVPANAEPPALPAVTEAPSITPNSH